MTIRRTRALVLLGHGSHHDAESSDPVHSHADALRRRGIFDEVLAAFWKNEPNLCHALDLTESDDLFVVPFFISEGYFTQEVIPRELEIHGGITRRGNRRILYAEPVGTHPAMTAALRHCAETAVHESGSALSSPKETTLIIVGHGTTKNERSAEAILRQVDLLKNENYFAEVLPAFLEQSPPVGEVLQRVRTPNAIAVPFFISDGLHSRQDVPIVMGFAQKGHRWKNPVEVKAVSRGTVGGAGSFCLWYARAVGMDPQMAAVILERVRELEEEVGREPQAMRQESRIPAFGEASPATAGGQNPPIRQAQGRKSRSSPHRTARRAREFAQEVKTAGSIELGELLVRSEGAVFSVCHRADQDMPHAQLMELQSPEEAHELARTTSDGKYRPLNSAPTLRRGWIIRNLNAQGLGLFVNLMLPGVISRHAAFKKGALRIRSFQQVAARQSGLYSDICRMSDDQVRSLARECCGQGCVQTPMWPIRDGSSEFVIQKTMSGRSLMIPCPEICSFAMATGCEALRGRKADDKL